MIDKGRIHLSVQLCAGIPDHRSEDCDYLLSFEVASDVEQLYTLRIVIADDSVIGGNDHTHKAGITVHLRVYRELSRGDVSRIEYRRPGKAFRCCNNPVDTPDVAGDCGKFRPQSRGVPVLGEPFKSLIGEAARIKQVEAAIMKAEPNGGKIDAALRRQIFDGDNNLLSLGLKRHYRGQRCCQRKGECPKRPSDLSSLFVHCSYLSIKVLFRFLLLL